MCASKYTHMYTCTYKFIYTYSCKKFKKKRYKYKYKYKQLIIIHIFTLATYFVQSDDPKQNTENFRQYGKKSVINI